MSEAVPNIQRPEVEQKDASVEITQKEAEDIVFWSYYYSQGLPDLQKKILRYVKDMHPEWIVPDAIPVGELYNRLHTFVGKATEKGKHEKSYRPDSETVAEIYQMFDALQKGFDDLIDKKSPESQMESRRYWTQSYGVRIMEDMLDRDVVFSNKRITRDAVHAGPFRRTIIHFADYILRGEKPPGPEVYKELFDNLRKLLNIPETWGMLDAVHLRYILKFKKEYEKPVDLSTYPIPPSVLAKLEEK